MGLDISYQLSVISVGDSFWVEMLGLSQHDIAGGACRPGGCHPEELATRDLWF